MKSISTTIVFRNRPMKSILNHNRFDIHPEILILLYTQKQILNFKSQVVDSPLKHSFDTIK